MFVFHQSIILENERVKLIPLEESHIDDLVRFSVNEPDLWKYSLVPADGIENLKVYISLALKAKSEGHSYPFLVIDKNTDTVAGSTRFYDYQIQHNTIQLGYTWYGKEYQRTGLNQNCKFLLLKFAFEKLLIERVEFRADAKNERSIQAMLNLGCVKEGILRSNCSAPEGRRDSIVLSILRHEWMNTIREQLIARIMR